MSAVTCGGQKRAPDSLELNLPWIVNRLDVSDESWAQVLRKSKACSSLLSLLSNTPLLHHKY